MSEPGRPPPPKSYIPLDLSTGPPKLPPRPQAADAGPPPNYTPPPPPLSDEEEEEVTHNPHPTPPIPYQPRAQPQQNPPTHHGGLHPAPSRPSQPPAANTPSPDTLFSSSSSAGPRTRPRAATLASPQPTSRAKNNKRVRPDITVMSAHPMTEGPRPPPRSLPPTSPPPPTPSSTTQSPRVPSRKAPTRPPPSMKAPTRPPQRANGGVLTDRTPSPVAPPRRHKTDAGLTRTNPPLRKSVTFPPRSQGGLPQPLNPTPERKTSAVTTASVGTTPPPKPAPYRANRQPASKPPVKTTAVVNDSVGEKSFSSGQEPPAEVPSGIRIISARKPRPPQQRAKAKETTEVVIDMGVDVVPQSLSKETIVASETTVTTETDTTMTTETTDMGRRPQPQARKRTKTGTTRANNDQVLPPQAKERTKAPEKNQRSEGTPPPKPRRSISREKITTDTPPQPRPRAASFCKPPLSQPPPAEQTKVTPPPSRRYSASLPRRPKPPPPSRPSLTTVPAVNNPAALVEIAPKVKARSQLTKPKEEGAPEDPNKLLTHVSKPVRVNEPVTEDIVPSGNADPVKRPPEKKPKQEEDIESQPTALQRKPSKSGVPGKPPPPRQASIPQLMEELQPPVAKRRVTHPEQKKKGEDDGQISPQAVKRQTKRRPPMVIHPSLDLELSENKSTTSMKPAAPVSGSRAPKPARPPTRPSTGPSRRQGQTGSMMAALSEENTAAVPRPLVSSDQPPTTEVSREAVGGTPQTSETSAQDEDTISTAVSEPEVSPTKSMETDANIEETKKGSQEESLEPQSHEEQKAEAVESAAEGKFDADADIIAEKTTVAEETKQENTGVGVVLRRGAADAGVIQLETHPKRRSRPMSMPPGRPGRPPILSKPGKPARPAHGPPRPAHGPLRPKAPSTPANTPTSPLDPNIPPPLPPRPTPGHLLYKYVCTEPHGIALANHEPTDPVELPYEADDVIELIEKIDDRWFYARNADLEMCEGMIPARDLQIMKRLPGESTVSGFEEGPCAIATFTFRGQSIGELSFNEGDLLMLKTRVGAEWLRGKLVSGQEGIFPRSFVEIVEDLPADAVEAVPAPTQSQTTVEIHGPHCLALYDFEAGGADELSLSVGDTVELLARAGAEWLRGRLEGREGIFPSKFVEIKEDLPPVVDDGFSKTLFDFDGKDGELSFKTGVRVKVLCRVNEEWVEGEMEGKRGIFPVSFVDYLPPDLPQKTVTTETLHPTKPTGKCEAVFDFTAENAGELGFKTGDVIVTSEWVNEEWMSGRLGGQEGMFPVAFVKILKELPTPTAAKDPPKGLTHVTKLDDSLLPRAEALKDCTATDSNKLSFKAGDILNLLEKIANDWYSGENTRTGSFGDFPASSVRVIEPLP